ncbi:MAG: DUF1501 domain-containing protein [Deltaproteobacteria bacterium]|nr:DUF1501 domain-containing protein [Deltaproteobacteria bacterium]
MAKQTGENNVGAYLSALQRRTFLRNAGYGLGATAAYSLGLGRAMAGSASGAWKGVVSQPHFPVRAKRVIHLCMAGAPSQFESFDWKPALKKLHGQPFPASLTKGQQLAQLQNTTLRAMGSFVNFKRWGQSGQEISELFPHIGGIADDIAIVRSMYTEQINHDPAHAFMNAGSILKGRPSMGSWMLYGLGSEADDLPGFVVMVSLGRQGDQPISSRQWSSGFLPSRFQGIQFQSKGDAVHFAGSPAGVTEDDQARVIETVRNLDRLSHQTRLDPEIATRVSQYEMAARMQTSVPELTNFANEPKHVLQSYGITRPGDGSFASNCLMARRLAERGVRFIQLYHRAWDHHSNLTRDMPTAAKQTDQASAALINDLKQRGMLDDTLVIWGGEFGRTPMAQGDGRDHHIKAFSLWLAGGGIKGGVTHGETDELGYDTLPDKRVAVRDLHATMLKLCGIDHKRLTFPYQGLDQKLTGVEEAHVVQALLK